MRGFRVEVTGPIVKPRVESEGTTSRLSPQSSRRTVANTRPGNTCRSQPAGRGATAARRYCKAYHWSNSGGQFRYLQFPATCGSSREEIASPAALAISRNLGDMLASACRKSLSCVSTSLAAAESWPYFFWFCTRAIFSSPYNLSQFNLFSLVRWWATISRQGRMVPVTSH